MDTFFVTKARTQKATPLSLLKEAYPSFRIDDAFCYDFTHHVVLGFTGLSRPTPILRYLVGKKEIQIYLSKLSDNSLLLFILEAQGIFAYLGSQKIQLTGEIERQIKETVILFEDYGGRLNNDGSLTLDLFSPAIGPHYGVNLLLGWREGYKEPLLTTPKSVVDSFGGGSFRADASYQVLATRWDIRPEENGNPFNRQFYLLENGHEIFYSGMVTSFVKKALCTHYPNKTIITYELNDGLFIKRTIFLLAQKPGLPEANEVQLVELTSPTARNLTIVFTGVFGFSNPECQEVDVIYQTVIHETMTLTDGQNRLVALSPSYYPEYFKRKLRFVSLNSDEGLADAFTSDSTSFLGKGSIEYPENLAHLDNAYRYQGASFFALSKMVTLLPSRPLSVWTFTGMADASQTQDDGQDDVLRQKVKALHDAYPNKEALLSELTHQEEALTKYDSFFSAQSGAKSFDAMVNRNLPFQTLYQTFVSRGFAQTQKGYREIGFREVQDLYASIPYLVSDGKAILVKALLSKWISNVYRMGYVNHNFFEKGKEPGMCSDDGLWLIPAVRTYLSLTNDIAFLKEPFAIADGGKRPLLETLEAIIFYSSQISVGKHGLPLLDKADWNDCLKIDPDCLDGPTKEARYKAQLKAKGQQYGVAYESEQSESVMNAFLLSFALEAMADIYHLAGKEDLALRAKTRRSELGDRIRSSSYHNGYYARVLINRAHPQNAIRFIGIPGDGLSQDKSLQNGSIFLNSLSWSMLSGVASESEITSMLSLADRYLKTPSGYQLVSAENLLLTGAKESATSHYFFGDRENGGVFKHAAMMFAVGCLRAAKRPYEVSLRETLVKDAFDMLRLTYPYQVLANPAVKKGNPRFCTQYTNPLTGENIGPILSGTATWLTLAIEEMAGFSFHDGALSFHPILPKESGDFAYSLRLHDDSYQVKVKKDPGKDGFQVASITCDGVFLKEKLSLWADKSEGQHQIVVSLK